MRPLTIAKLSLALALLLACGGEPTASPDAAAPSRSMLDAPSVDVTAPLAEVSVPEAAPTVLFMGDSIGAGLHLAEHQAFPALLQQRLAATGQPFHLVNASESGRTAAGGASAIEWSLRTDPDVVVIELGGNDGLRGISIEQTERNLRTMIEASRAAGARVMLLGVRLPPNYGEAAAKFDALYPALAQEYDLTFVPFFMDGVGGVPEMNLADGLHPTAAGHERLAQNVESSLRGLLIELSGD